MENDEWRDRVLGYRLSGLAKRRMQQNGVRREAVVTCLLHGRRVRTRRALIFVVGRREVAEAREKGIRIDDCDNGLHVVTAEAVVMTVYKNRHLMIRDTKYRRTQRQISSDALKAARRQAA